MKIVIGLMITHLYTDLLLIYPYKEILGLKYSKTITIMGTILFWISDCLFKIFPQYFFGIESLNIINIIMWVTGWIYIHTLYASNIKKKVLVYFLYYIVQASMDFLGLKIVSTLTGENLMFQQGSDFTFLVLGCSVLTITLGTVVFVWAWKILERKNWKISRFQWICLILPMSQYLLLCYNSIKYTAAQKTLPDSMVVGVVLAIFADIYMFVLFNKLSRKEEIERELRQLEHQYELEQLRYEQLKEAQEETAKIRHDFQNYILTMKQME